MCDSGLPPLCVKEEKKLTARVGLVIFLIMPLSWAAQMGLDAILPQQWDPMVRMWGLVMVSQYLIAYPLVIALFRFLPARPPRRQFIDGRTFWRLFCISYLLLMVGNLLGTVSGRLWENRFGLPANYWLEQLLDQSNLLWLVLVLVVLAPLYEELIFRKLLLDRLLKYGELPAVLTSGMLFGLYHGNVEQFFYAVFIGWLLAYIYVKTGRICYCVILHMLVNFFGSIVPLQVLRLGNELWAGIYGLLVLLFLILGLIYGIRTRGSWHFQPSPFAVDNRTGIVIIWNNWGMYLALFGGLLFFFW